jgi:diguanylate cyclase (GGDEF)-like protein/PAS domain S-box-containing protein
MTPRVALLRAALIPFVFVGIFSLAGGLATLWAVLDALESARLVARDHEVLANVERTISDLRDAESHLRAYANSGDSTDLGAALRAMADVRMQLGILRVQRDVSSVGSAEPAGVPRRLDAWINQLAASVPNHAADARADVAKMLESGAIPGAFSRAHQAFAAIRADARGSLAGHQVLSDSSNHLLIALTIADMLSVSLVLVFASRLIARGMARRGWYDFGLRNVIADSSDAYERAPCGYVSHNAERTLVKINDTALAWLGYSRDEVVDKFTIDDIFVPAEVPEMRVRFEALVKEGDRFESHCRLQCRDGSTKNVLLSTTAVRDPDRPALMARSIFADTTALAHAEESLRLSEERFRGAFEAAAIGMALVGLEGRFLRVNRALCEIIGYPEPQLLELTCQDITHPDDTQADLAHVRSLLCGASRSYRMEKRCFHKNGQVVHVVLSVSLLRDSGGCPVHFVVQIEDITEHKRIEAALRESEERFRSVCDCAPVMIWMGCLITGKCTFVNRSGLEFLGTSFDEIEGRGWLERVHPEDRVRVAFSYAAAAAVRRSISIEFRMRRADGLHRWVGGNAIPRFMPDGSFSGYIGTMSDVSERHEAEEARKASEARFYAFMNHSPAVAFMKDYEGRILYVNRTMERSFDFRLEDVRNKRAFPGMPDDVLEETLRNDRAVLDAGEPAQFLEVVPTPDGQLRSWQVMKFPFRDADGRLLLGGMAIDVTEQKELERRLAVANSRLKILATSDALTGLSNRRAVSDTLETSFALATRHRQPLSVLMIDVDHFKEYNDDFGHPAGDEILRAMAAVLRANVRSSDLPGRYGGEEFIVVLPETDSAGAVELAERVRTAIAAESWALRPVTVSVGVASLDGTTGDPLTLIEDADRALYESKRRGRNLVTHVVSVGTASGALPRRNRTLTESRRG